MVLYFDKWQIPKVKTNVHRGISCDKNLDNGHEARKKKKLKLICESYKIH